MADLSVADADPEDQTDLVLHLEPGMTVSGRIGFEGHVLEPPTDFSHVSLRIMPAPGPMGITISINPAMSQVSADGTFTLDGVTPGRYLLSANAPSTNGVPGVSWQIKSALVNGVDGVDTPFEVKPGQNIDNTIVTFTDQSAEVSGTLTDAAGKPTSDFSVLLFSADKTFWSARSRRVRSPVRTATDGTFKFTGLVAGDYYLAALTDFEPPDISNPAFLEQVAGTAAIKISVAEGEKKTQDIKLASQ
jgi:hypothetical protein